MANSFQMEVPMAKAFPPEELVADRLLPFSVTVAESWWPQI